jgi:hypothetical protein
MKNEKIVFTGQGLKGQAKPVLNYLKHAVHQYGHNNRGLPGIKNRFFPVFYTAKYDYVVPLA